MNKVRWSKHIIGFILALSLLFHTALGQTGTALFEAYTDAMDMPEAIIQNNSKHILLSGGSLYNSTWHAFILELDTFGKIIQATKFSPAYLRDIKNSNDGKYIVSGKTRFGLFGDEQSFVAKIDTDGSPVWYKVFRTSSGGGITDRINAIINTYDNGIVAVGIGERFDTRYGDVAVYKFDSLGNMEWKRFIGDATYNEGFAVLQTPTELVVLGTTINAGQRKLFLIFMDALGSLIRTIAYSEINADLFGYNMVRTPDRNYLLIGFYKNYSQTTGDFYILKVDSLGNILWSSRFGTPLNNEVPNSITITPDSGFIVAGAGEVKIGSTPYSGTLLVKFDKNGNFKWSRLITHYTGISDYINVLWSHRNTIFVSAATNSSSFSDVALMELSDSGLIDSCNLMIIKDSGQVFPSAPTMIANIANNVDSTTTFFSFLSDTLTFDSGFIKKNGCGSFGPCADFTYTITKIDSVSCNGYTDGAIYLSVSGGIGPYSHKWTTGDSTPTISNLPTGTYIDTITDHQGCKIITEPINVIEPPSLAATIDSIRDSLSCYYHNEGFIFLTTSGGTPPYSHNWNNGLFTTEDIANLPPGTYIDSITDANGCSLTMGPYTIASPPKLVITATIANPSCNGTHTGYIFPAVSGGIPPYSYNWHHIPGTNDPDSLNSLSAGTYILVVSDTANCTISDTFVLVEPSPISISGIVHNVSCYDYADGSIDLTISGGTPPYRYDWLHTPQTIDPQDVQNLSPGAYSVVIVDYNGCSDSATFYVFEPDSLQLSASLINATCNNSSDGRINLHVHGGTPPYNYDWQHIIGTSDPASALGLIPGQYSVTVTDANNCSVFATYNIGSDNTSPSIVLDSIKHVSCFNQTDGSIFVHVVSGTPPYSYLWTPSFETTPDITNVPAGWYFLQVTDSIGCSVIDSFLITQPHKLIVNIHTSSDSLIATINGGTNPYHCLWNTGATTCSIPINSSGTYFVLVTDSSGCQSSSTVYVNVTNSFMPLSKGCKITLMDKIVLLECYQAIQEINVFDLSGKLISKFKTPESNVLSLHYSLNQPFIVKILLHDNTLYRKIIYPYSLNR